MRTVEEYSREVEGLRVALNLEQYNQDAGLGYDARRMEDLAARIERLAQTTLETLPQEAFPRLLFWDTVTAARQSAYTRLANEIYRLRTEVVAVEADGERVSLSNWRLFNRAHLRDHALRRRVFDGLMERAETLGPVLEERFALSRQVTAAYGATPLSVYLDDEQVDLDTLRTVVRESASRALGAFRELAGRYSDEILGKPMEYHDDYYVFVNAIHEPLDAAVGRADWAAALNRAYTEMGFDLARISIDGDPRDGKTPSPACYPVQVPADVRVLFQRTSPVADYTGYAHEMGHALHFASIEPQRTFAERYLAPAGVAEVFSTLFETLAAEPAFLGEVVGLPASDVAELRARERFMELYFLVFYGANALFKIRFWSEGLRVADADGVYADLAEACMGLPLPGRYWRTHHVVSLFDVYAPSYLLAKIRVEELKGRLRAEFGERWWASREAGAYVRDRLMAPGASMALGEFSRLDPAAYWRFVGIG